jgi:serine/threonine protein kinase
MEMESSADTQRHDDDILLDMQRVYCLLFKDCPSRTLRNVIQKHRKKLDNHKSGWIEIETALGIFRQMAVAVSVLHDSASTMDDPSDPSRPGGIVHMDLKPEHFAAFKTSRDVTKGCKYIIKLVGAGCAIDGGMPLDYVADRMKAERLIESTTSPNYRAPEMVNLHLANELTDSVDIWALGCCLYGILFLKDCFQPEEKQNILDGKYEIPHGHLYSSDVLALLARLLNVDPDKRPDIHEVISCVDALVSGKPLPPRRSKPARFPTSKRQPESFEGPHSVVGDKVGWQSIFVVLVPTGPFFSLSRTLISIL